MRTQNAKFAKFRHFLRILKTKLQSASKLLQKLQKLF
nr:MAG TPA: hypothetical protein [Caudoviricetes sp.]